MLKIDNVSAGYEDQLVLHGVSLEVKEGEVVSLLGANGAGKTTTLRVISGLLPPQGGRVIFEGRDITSAMAHERAQIGLIQVPEGRQLFPRMTVLENLELGAYSKRAKEHLQANLERVFDLFPVLKERCFQLAGSLSGGEQQMLAIARGLMSIPKVLLLDEPSLGLAPKMVRIIFDSIRGVNQEEHVTVLLVEQNVFNSIQISSRVYVLENGEVALSGSAAEMMENPKLKKAYLGM